MNNNLIYIASHGHSGSTLLDMLLGTHNDIFSTGELVHLPNQYHRNKLYEPAPSNGLSCSCGKGFYDCEFWGPFINELNKQVDYDVIKYPLKFNLAFLMSHSIPHQKIKHKFLRDVVFQSIKNNLFGLDHIMQPNLKKRIKNNETLIQLIHQLTNKKYIVDSTKDFFRLHYLLKSNLNVHIIVLKRNIWGVAASEKKLSHSPLITAKHWLKYYHKLDIILKKNHVKSICIDYEDLVDNPKATLNIIYKYLGLPKIETFSNSFSTTDYHIVAGNGLRYKGEVKIKKDESWKTILSEDEKSKIKALINNSI